MAQFRKTILEPGTYETRKGAFNATPERFQKWAEQLRAMKDRGIRVPISWGHQPHAFPATTDQIAENEYHKSRYNAGYLEDLSLTETGALQALGDLPGLEVRDGNVVDPQTGTAIAEVSVGVGDWTDGQGHVWEDALIHLALTPLPVYAGQPGFDSLSAQPAEGVVALRPSARVSHTLATGDPAMDHEDDDKEKKDAPDDSPAPGNSDLKEIVDLLAGMEIKLPPSASMANPKEFIGILKVALHAVQDHIGKKGADVEEPVEEPAATTEEKPPMLLSTAGVKDPVKIMTINNQISGTRNARMARLVSLARRDLPKFLFDKLKEETEATGVYLLSTGAIAPQAIDHKLDLLEQLFPEDKGSYLLNTQSAGGATEVALPSFRRTGDPLSPDEIKKLADQQHARR